MTQPARARGDEAEQAYQVWLGVAHRNVSDVARRMGFPRTTVQSWHDRHRWQERANDDDLALVADTVGDAWRSLALLVPDAVRRVAAAVRYRDAEGLAAPVPDTKDAWALLARFGIVAQRTVTVRTESRMVASVSDPDLAALVAAGDTATLAALASGRTIPPAALPPPPDFTSDQPGGREASEPSPPDRAPSLPREAEPDYGIAVDAYFRELTSEPAPERHDHPGGETDDEVPQEPT